MSPRTIDKQIIYTNKARCRDCYRCLRNCPVNAIRLKNGQAAVETERCILCGLCLKECPQGAKQFRRDVEKVKKLLRDNEKVAVSIAPSFPSIFETWETERIPSVLRKLGFSYVSETAEAAFYVARESEKYFTSKNSGMCLSTACPSFVNYIEKYQPEDVKKLVPVVSPMIAHAKRIKEKLGKKSKFVFIGPCLAKKGEAERSLYAGIVDVVLTFTEFLEWIEEDGVDIKMLEASEFDEKVIGDARLFPLTGGMSKTASLEADNFNTSVYSLSGMNEIRDAINSFENTDSKILIEPLVCAAGCVNGPGLPKTPYIYSRKEKVISYAKNKHTLEFDGVEDKSDLQTSFSNDSVIQEREFTEEEIRQTLERTGKLYEEDQLNCGACGYSSCLENAKAILQGMVEYESCIPYTRRLAEQRTDKVIETSPNGIVMLNHELEILHMNPAFKKFFMCTNSVIGKRISYLMDPEPFVKLTASEKNKIDITVKHENYHITCHELLYKLPEEKQYVGIFVNITKNLADAEKLDSLREKTINQAQELLDHQIEMAQSLAKLLGENTAKGEELVENLLKLTQDEQIKSVGRKKNWLWDTYTSK
jgi:iron only hydrogenase large subunit-like protein